MVPQGLPQRCNPVRDEHKKRFWTEILSHTVYYVQKKTCVCILRGWNRMEIGLGDLFRQSYYSGKEFLVHIRREAKCIFRNV